MSRKQQGLFLVLLVPVLQSGQTPNIELSSILGFAVQLLTMHSHLLKAQTQPVVQNRKQRLTDENPELFRQFDEIGQINGVEMDVSDGVRLYVLSDFFKEYCKCGIE
jgi:hypothetical protein